MAGLFDFSGFGLGNQNWFNWQGQPSAGQPGQPMQLTGTQSPVGTTPTGTPAYSPEMIAQSRYSMLAQAGMQLMAAGQPMSGAQRAQYIAQLGQLPASYQQSLATQLEQAQKQKAYQQQQQQQAYLGSLSTEELQKMGFTPEQATIFKGMGAPADIMEKKMFAGQGDPNTQVVEVGGRKMLIDQRTGQTVKDLGPVVEAPRSPELVTLTPPSGSKAQPQTFNVNDPADYAKAHELMTQQNWTRAPAGTTINMPKQPTAEQSRVIYLYPNIYQAQKQLDVLDKELTQPGGDLATKFGGNYSAYMQSPAYQQAVRAQTNWTSNLLYAQSGAQKSPAEVEDARRAYFPLPGEDPKTVADKRRAREAAMHGLRTSLGDLAETYVTPEEQRIDQQMNPDLGAP